MFLSYLKCACVVCKKVFLSELYWNIYYLNTGCEIEPPVINGIVIPPKFNKIGSILRYKCVKGHEPTGTPEVLCMPNGEWALPNFDCIICKYKYYVTCADLLITTYHLACQFTRVAK